MNTEFEIAELKRRLDNLIRFGTIAEIDYEAEPPCAKIADGEELTTGWIPFMTRRANGQEVSWDAPEVGERVTVLCISGDPANARIMPGAIYCADHPAPAVNPDVITRMHKDGAHDTYDRAAHVRTIQIHEDGELKLIVGGTSITITKDAVLIDSPSITLTGDTVTADADTITLDGETHLGGAGGEPVARKGDDINTTTKKITKGSSDVFST